MKSFLKISTYVILPLLTLVLGWQLGVRSETLKVQNMIQELDSLYGGNTGSGTLVTDPEKEVDIAILWSVWRLLIQEYIEPNELDSKKMLYGSVAGMVRAIGDPYTVFMTPKENTDFIDNLGGNLQGIGAELTLKDDILTVVAPLKGSPAALAGLLPDDIILEVNGEPTLGKPLNDLVQTIRGPEGTTVTLGIGRQGTAGLIELEITREEITVPSTEYELKEIDGKNIGYISVNQFGDNTTTETKAAIESFSDTELDGLIVDLRFNGGGYLEKAIDLVSMFISEGKVAIVERRDSEPLTHFVLGRPLDTTTPMVVLINEGSASASEILAGALQDYERATIIGKQSFGKGTIQEVYNLPGGASIRITIAQWLTPNGNSIAEQGITPDYEVDRTLEDFQNEVDPQLDAALEFLANDTIPVNTGSGTALTGSGEMIE